MTSDAQPFYFPSAAGELFGWLHAAAPERAASGLGLVLCAPFGYEALCAHRTLRCWAEAAAARGIATLRFDYAGYGDSVAHPERAGTTADTADPEPTGATELLALWAGSIGAAVTALHQHCGVSQVCLAGLRLGALAATLAAPAAPGLMGLIAMVPVISGRRYLRELRAFQGSLGEPAAASGVPAAQGFDVTGFHLPAATVARLAGIDVAALPDPPAPEMLVLDRDDLPGAAGWAQGLSQRGARVRYEALPGFVRMNSTPHASVVPWRMISAALSWLEPLAARAGAACPPGGGTAARPAPSLRLRVANVDVTERPVFIDAGCTLFGIVSAPAGADRCGRGVVLLNAGASSHVGPSGLYVTLARRWAAQGHTVLRFDLAGLGDSATREGRPQNEVYPPAAVADVRAAVAYLQAHHRIDAPALAGLCAGAYHALRAAVAGVPASRLLMINPLTFFWRPGMTLSDLQDADVLRGPAVYRERLRSGKSWRKLLTGRVDPRPIMCTLAHRGWMALAARLRDLARRLHIHLADDLGWDLQALAARGVEPVFFFARGDAGAQLLALQAGSALRRLGPRCRIHVVDGADHIFSQRSPRALLGRLLDEELMPPPPPAAQREDGASRPTGGDQRRRENWRNTA